MSPSPDKATQPDPQPWELVLASFREFLTILERRLADAGLPFEFEVLKEEELHAETKRIIGEAYTMNNHGAFFPSDVDNIARIAIHLLEDPFVNDNRPLHVFSKPTQSGKSAIEHVSPVLIPILELLVSGEQTYPILIITNETQHALVMAHELTIRAAMFSALRIRYKNGEYRRVDSDLLPEMYHNYSRIIVRTIPKSLIRFEHEEHSVYKRKPKDEEHNLWDAINNPSSNIKRLFIVVDECHFGRGERQIYPKLIDTLKSFGKRFSMLAVSATPTEFMAAGVKSKLHWIKGTVDAGYRSFDFDQHLYSASPDAKIPRVRVMVHEDYLRDRYGLSLASARIARRKGRTVR